MNKQKFTISFLIENKTDREFTTKEVEDLIKISFENIENISVVENKKEKTDAEKLHEGNEVHKKIDSCIDGLFEKHEPEIYDHLEFSTASDYYDNSLEVYFKSSLPYPYEPCHKIRDEIMKFGFSIIYWNFIKDETAIEIGGVKDITYDEVRGREPRHYKNSLTWKKNQYGYVDDRFNETDWVEKYKMKK